MKRIKPFLLLLLLLVCFLFPMSIHTASAEYITQEEPKVYIQTKGSSDYRWYYHKASCKYVSGGLTKFYREAVGLYQAESMEFKPCPLCGGDPIGVIEVKYYLTETQDEGSNIDAWGVILIIGIAVYDTILLTFVLKNFRLDLMLRNITKFRNIVLIAIAILITAVSFFYITKDVLIGILCFEIAAWVWMQALFSD